ncbi:tyrosinase [Pholiota conissans]|uniref:tyrosinase n=1 Tax=Pholiota conissans TaxID=109636 RepID=A0A9P5YX13_9AGAR|nr:tyrosinase [Pholiota conissans]
MYSSDHHQGCGHGEFYDGIAHDCCHEHGHGRHPNPPAPPAPPKNTHYPTKGAAGCYERLEIHDFVKNEKFFSLYIQALDAAYNKVSPDNVESFFQVAGIHGRPYQDYAGAKGTGPAGKWAGYCTHSTVLFPTWHRPYVALLEQVLQKRAIEIAEDYTFDCDDWMEAAVALRQPYWDWAIHSSPPPEVISMQQVTITNSNGERVLVNNPMYCYAFPQGELGSFAGHFQTWPTTLRCPTSDASAAMSDVKTLQSNLDKDGPNVRKATYNMLSQVFDWHGFATYAKGTNPTISNSLEAVHDGIHFKVGGMSQVLKGHMGDNDVAAFDPIFFLHHSNVDRLLSIWAALNPGIWVTPGDSADGTVSIAAGTTIDAQTPLAPFWHNSTTFWTSAELQNTFKFGYTYPDFCGLDMYNAKAVKSALSRRVNTLYGSTTAPAPGPGVPTPAPPSDGGSCPNFGAWDWAVRVHVKKYDVGMSFAVLFFLGDVAADPASWSASDACIGRQYVLVNSNPENCANCQTQSDVVLEGFVHLNDGLQRYLRTVDPEKVAPYLRDHLQWRVQKIDGTAATPESLEVVVLAIPLSYPEGALFPISGKPRQYDSCTRGRPGGSRQAGNF